MKAVKKWDDVSIVKYNYTLCVCLYGYKCIITVMNMCIEHAMIVIERFARRMPIVHGCEWWRQIVFRFSSKRGSIGGSLRAALMGPWGQHWRVPEGSIGLSLRGSIDGSLRAGLTGPWGQHWRVPEGSIVGSLRAALAGPWGQHWRVPEGSIDGSLRAALTGP